MTLKAFNSRLVVISVGGVPLEGFGDAEKIVLAPLEDEVIELVGSDGEVVISATNNPVLRGTINLLQSSSSIDYLNSLKLLTAFSFQVNDLNGGAGLFLGTAWIFRRPDATYAKAAGVWSWQIGVLATTANYGGLPSIPALG